MTPETDKVIEQHTMAGCQHVAVPVTHYNLLGRIAFDLARSEVVRAGLPSEYAKPDQLAKFTCDLAEAFYKEFKDRDWLYDVPPELTHEPNPNAEQRRGPSLVRVMNLGALLGDDIEEEGTTVDGEAVSTDNKPATDTITRNLSEDDGESTVAAG